MHKDKRSRKIAIVAHCILNQNSRAKGLAKRPNAITEIVDFLLKNDVGIIQMPCPELSSAGTQREGSTKECYDNASFRKHCRKIAEEIVNQIQDYAASQIGTRVIIGVEGSPSCSVTTPGILMEELRSVLEKRQVSVAFFEASYQLSNKEWNNLERLIKD
jgi:predicted secreted protein